MPESALLAILSQAPWPVLCICVVLVLMMRWWQGQNKEQRDAINAQNEHFTGMFKLMMEDVNKRHSERNDSNKYIVDTLAQVSVRCEDISKTLDTVVKQSQLTNEEVTKLAEKLDIHIGDKAVHVTA
jgi:hypothetical protein